MNSVFRYIGYVALSLLFGYLSSIGERDLLYIISSNLFPVLITIIVLYVTLSNLVYNQISTIHSKLGTNISSGIDALKRNIKWMFVIISFDFLTFIIFDIIPSRYCDNCKDLFFLLDKKIAINAITFFSLFYYLYIIYDSAMAFFNLLKANKDIEE